MTVLPRAATSPELAYLRSNNQASRLYLTFFTPATVYTARLAAVPSSTDRVASITYDNGSGAAYADILPDQTLLIGTTAGGFDLGMARIRNTTGLAATSGTMNIGETSEIDWQANCYLTVLDEFLLWPRHPTVTNTTTYMDYDVAYVNQHRYCDSIPVLGPDRVVWLSGATVSVTFDGSQSWALNNTITAYLWTAPGASATSGLTTATPTITYNAVGTYRVGLQITNSDGAVFTGYRRVFVVTEASGVTTTFQLASLQGSYSSGGWSFQVKMSENAALPTLRDRMQVILHAKDNFGTTQTDLGYVAGSENVIAIGWIDQESIQWQREDLPGVVTFTVEGPHYWLNRMAMFPTGIKDRNSHPTKWTRFFGLTAKAIAWHLLHWRTTATRCIDVYPANNEWRGSRFDAPGAQTIWQQLSTILENSVIAKPCCDRYARLFMQVEQNLLSTTDRAAIPSVMTIAKGDWTNEVTFDRRIVNDVAYVDLSGVSWNGTTPSAFFALSPGHVFRHYGSVEVRERLVLYDQPTTLTLCGAYYGWKNNPYPRLTFNLAMNNRLIDLAPYQYMTVSIAAADTPRGFVGSALRVIPRTIRYNWNERAFALTTDIEVEAETSIGLSVIGDTPAEPPEQDEKPPQPIIPPQPVIVPPSAEAKEVWFATTDALYWAGDYFAGGQPTWNKITGLPITPDSVHITTSGQVYLVQSGYPSSAVWYNATPKSGSWSSVLTADHWLDGVDQCGVRNNTFFCITYITGFDYFYGEYNGSWTWRAATKWFYGNGGRCQVGYNCYTAKPITTLNAYTGAGASLGNMPMSGEAGGIPYTMIWVYGDTERRRQIISYTAAPHWRLWDLGGTWLGTANATNTPPNNRTLTGSYNGNRLMVVDYGDGSLYVADNGVFVKKAAWTPGKYGKVYDAFKAGGGSLVWFPFPSVSASAELSRISNDSGDTFSAMTGNFWSLTSGDQTITGVGLVF